MRTAIDHERARRAAVNQDGIQYTPEQLERQEILNRRGIVARRQHVQRNHSEQGGDEE